MVWVVPLLAMKLIPHCLTPEKHVSGIRSLSRFGTLVRALAQSVLYLQYTMLEASPKAISRSTSYFRVWLAFHPYPQLIQAVFNPHWFGPPSRVTGTSSWPRIAHSVSRLPHATKTPISDSLSLRLLPLRN